MGRSEPTSCKSKRTGARARRQPLLVLTLEEQIEAEDNSRRAGWVAMRSENENTSIANLDMMIDNSFSSSRKAFGRRTQRMECMNDVPVDQEFSLETPENLGPRCEH